MNDVPCEEKEMEFSEIEANSLQRLNVVKASKVTSFLESSKRSKTGVDFKYSSTPSGFQVFEESKLGCLLNVKIGQIRPSFEQIRLGHFSTSKEPKGPR